MLGSADKLIIDTSKHILGSIIDKHIGIELLVLERLAVAVKRCHLRDTEIY